MAEPGRNHRVQEFPVRRPHSESAPSRSCLRASAASIENHSIISASAEGNSEIIHVELVLLNPGDEGGRRHGAAPLGAQVRPTCGVALRRPRSRLPHSVA